MSNYVTTESSPCTKCGQMIRWSSASDDDMRFVGVLHKMRYHQENDKQCSRAYKLDELLGKDKQPEPKRKLDLTFLD